MNLVEVKKEIEERPYMRTKTGETIYDLFMEDDNTIHDIGEGIISVIEGCETEEQLQLVSDTLAAVCGYNLTSIIQDIREKDANNHYWIVIID